MLSLETQIKKYLDYCAGQKKLNALTLKAYSIDLKQFMEYQKGVGGGLDRDTVSQYITHLHNRYKPKSSKRKTASLKAFCSYLEYEEVLTV